MKPSIPRTIALDKEIKGWFLSPSKNVQLSNHGRTAIKTSGSRAAWDCNVLGTHSWVLGTHVWHVRLETTSNMMIGVASANVNATGPNYSSVGFYLGTLSGCLFGQDGTWKKDYLGTACNAKGTVISVKLELDSSSCKLWFGLAGNFQPSPAWTLPPTRVSLYPSFDMDDKGCSFTIF